MPDSPSPCSTKLYYVDSVLGSDENDGLSPSTPWSSLSKVNSASLLPGDKILFSRDKVWRGQLLPQSGIEGCPITYSDYGAGTLLPTLLGSLNASSTAEWTSVAANIWEYSSVILSDVGNIYFGLGNSPEVGLKNWQLSDLNSQGEFFYDIQNRTLKVYSTSNPGSFYTQIEIALTKDVVVISNKSHVHFENLAIKFGGAHGVNGSSTSNMRFKKLELSYLGGGDLNMNGTNIRYGNGIQFWQGAHDHVVENNLFWEIYDTAVTNQGHSVSSEAYKIIY